MCFHRRAIISNFRRLYQGKSVAGNPIEKIQLSQVGADRYGRLLLTQPFRMMAYRSSRRIGSFGLDPISLATRHLSRLCSLCRQSPAHCSASIAGGETGRGRFSLVRVVRLVPCARRYALVAINDPSVVGIPRRRSGTRLAGSCALLACTVEAFVHQNALDPVLQ